MSNTAHINFRLLNRLANGKIVNLVDKVVNRIEQDNLPHPYVLVLGTTMAYQRKLYPQALDKKNISSMVPTPEEQEIIEDMICRIKSYRRADPTTLLNIINRKIHLSCTQNNPITHILLGCTELTIALRGKSEELKALIKAQYGIELHIIDSEELFAKTIAEDVITSCNIT